MSGFAAGYLDIQPHEIVEYLLKESGQDIRDAVNLSDVLNLLKLEHLIFDFNSALQGCVDDRAGVPRAMLSYPDRLVATDSELSSPRERFSILHEVAHYILPSHQYKLYLCDEKSLSDKSLNAFEKEANNIASDFLFQGDRFTLEVNSHPINVQTVKLLADKYQASYEATSRRLAKKNCRPCMFISFCRASAAASRLETGVAPVWTVRYCVSSPTFESRYFPEMHGQLDAAVADYLCQQSKGICDSFMQACAVRLPSGEAMNLVGEFFYNQYNILGFITVPDGGA